MDNDLEALRNQALSLYEAKNFREAEVLFRQMVKALPDSAIDHYDMGRALQGQGEAKYPDALAAYSTAETLWARKGSQDRTYGLRAEANVLRLLKKYPEAEAKLHEALQIDATNADFHNLLGVVLQNQGKEKYPAAIDCFAEAVSRSDETTKDIRKYALDNWGDTLRFLERYQEAEAKYRDAIATDGKYAAAYDGLGLALQGQGPEKYLTALEQFVKTDELLRQDKRADREYALSHWADVLRLLKRLPESESKYHEAIDANGRFAHAHHGLGVVLREQGQEKYPAAMECFKRADALWKQEGSKDRKFALASIADTLRLMEHFAEAERKCREAIELDGEYASAYNILGLSLEGQGKDKYPAAIEQFAKAESLDKMQRSKYRKYPLSNWGWLLGSMEDYEQALEKLQLAVEVDPDDWERHYNLGNGLADCGRYLEALDAYDKAIARDSSDPYPFHNKAHYLFYLGRYADGWKAWQRARSVYDKTLLAGLQTATNIDRATHFASVLSGHYVEREAAERWYRAVLARKPAHQPALTALAILYFEWSKSEKPSPTALAQLSYTAKKSMDALKARLGKGDDWRNAMDLANYCIDTEDFVAAADWLGRAEAACGESLARRAEVAGRCGVLHARREQFDKAIERFQEALLGDPSDLKMRTNLAEAFLKLKQMSRAEEEYRKVLAIAPGNIEALIGCAQVCIELAEAGDVDRCAQAEKHLGSAIQFGELTEEGSKRLVGKELAQVYYLRGYVRVKRYESDSGAGTLWTLMSAENDFKRCRKLDKTDYKANSALEKLRKKVRTTQRDKLLDWIGPFVVCLAATAVFVFAQMDFFFAGKFGLDLFATKRVTDTGYYALLSFGAIVFMVAGLYLPKVLKLKVGAIELEKGAVEQISTPTSLGISR